MIRYVGAVVGFCAISAAYIGAVMMGLFLLVMSHCPQSDVQRAAGETCTRPADLFFWPAVVVAVIGLVFLQWRFLRWVLRKEP